MDPRVQGMEAMDAAMLQQDMSQQPGGQGDALRHALWMAKMAQSQGNRYTPQIIGMGHEAIGLGKAAIDALRGRDKPGDFRRVLDESVMDWKNNRAGAELGALSPGDSQEALVAKLRQAPLESLPPYWDKK